VNNIQNSLIDTLFTRFTGMTESLINSNHPHQLLLESSGGVGGDSSPPIHCCAYCSRPSSDSSLTTLDCGVHRICAHCYSSAAASATGAGGATSTNQSMMNSRKNSTDTESCTSGGGKINKHLMNTISEGAAAATSASIESSSSVSSTDEANNLDERFKKSFALKCKLCSIYGGVGQGAHDATLAAISPPLSSSPATANYQLVYQHYGIHHPQLQHHLQQQRFPPSSSSLTGDDSNTLFNNFGYNINTYFSELLREL
jgi:hypothetical protein